MPRSSLSLVLAARPDAIGPAADAAEAFVRDHGLDPSASFAVMVCLDEALSNIVRHGGSDGTDHRIEVVLTLDETRVELSISDDGRPFDPLRDAPAPDLTSPWQSRPPGGLGVHILRTAMDDATYRHDGRRNVLTLCKRRATDS